MTLILSGTDGLSDVDGTAATPAIRGTDTNTGIFFPAADTIAFSEGGVEAMRLDSVGNVGIGTSSPGSILELNRSGSGAVGPNLYLENSASSATGNASRISFGIDAGASASSPTAYIENVKDAAGPGSSYMAFGTFGSSLAERMRIDGSGNLGLGVTPSAWGSDTRALQIFNRTSLSDLQSTTQLTNNGIWNGTNWVYRETAAAGNYNINGNSHVWRIAPSGTAGNTISFTQAMTLDASGNLGINSTSPSTFGKVTVQVDGTTTPTNLTNVGPSSINLYAAANGGSTNSTMGIFGWNATTGIGSGIGFVRENGSDWGTQIRFYTHPTTTSNIGDITERARITSAGYLLVGTTAATGDARLSVNNPDNVSGDFCFVTTLGSNCNNTSSYHYIAVTGAADKFYVYGNGNVVNTNGSYGTLSDVKLKENIVDATPKLADVMRLQVRNFNLKTEPGHKQIGFVAQEFEQVFPAMVDESPDRDEEGNQLETTTKHIKTSVLVPILVKAIQEQQAIIESLTARITALEAK